MKLTKQSRIILNTLATYGRSLIALLLGVFSSRWLLQGLGAQDLGLQGVVGSLVSVIIIFETVMQVAVARFYSYAIGQTQTMGGEDELCRWFNVVFLIYVVMPVLVTVIGYQVGIYAIKHWLEIPGERMSACLYVFRCSILASFISVVSVPYIAMYQAHQEIVELSMFGLLRSIMNFLLAFSLIYVIAVSLACKVVEAK